jgi:glycosyltransferase involved in cell wall biosynthesis
VHRLGPGGELAELFAAADVFCLPTSVDAVPWAVLEAMASGTAVVSTDVGSIPELLAAGTDEAAGIVVPPGDPVALGAALDRLLDDPQLRAAMGKHGRERAEVHYDATRNTPRLIELLADVARRHRSARLDGR